MIKCFCDICGKEFTNDNKGSRYKIKKGSKWYNNKWESLVVHETCWQSMCQLIKDKRG